MPSSEVREIADRLEKELRLLGRPERAEGARRYLRSDLLFVGADTAAVRAVSRGILGAGTLADRDGTLELVGALWRRRIFELRAAAVEILRARAGLLRARDLRGVEPLIRDSHTWALVDPLAIHVTGAVLVRFPRVGAELDRWAGDADFWMRRAALLALLLPLRRGAGDFERFSRYADAMLEERECFVRKAIGWALREAGKGRPELVAGWLAPRARRASGVTVRETVRYLPEAERCGLLAAYRARRPDRRGGAERRA